MNILQLCNYSLNSVLDGGHARVIALDQWIDSQGGKRIVIQDEVWRKSKVFRQLRPLSLLRQIWSVKPDVIICRFPSYPFFMSANRNSDLIRSMAFAALLRYLVLSKGIRLIVDVGDLFKG